MPLQSCRTQFLAVEYLLTQMISVKNSNTRFPLVSLKLLYLHRKGKRCQQHKTNVCQRKMTLSQDILLQIFYVIQSMRRSFLKCIKIFICTFWFQIKCTLFIIGSYFSYSKSNNFVHLQSKIIGLYFYFAAISMIAGAYSLYSVCKCACATEHRLWLFIKTTWKRCF